MLRDAGYRVLAYDLSHKASPLQPFVEQRLMEGHDLTAALQMRAIESDEVTVIGEWRDKSLGAALAPAVHQVPTQRAYGSFVAGCLPRSGARRQTVCSLWHRPGGVRRRP